MPSDFFTSLGQAVAAKIAAQADTRPLMDKTLSNHLHGPMARDQAMPRGPRYGDQADMPVRGAEREPQYSDNIRGDQEGGEVSGADCLQFVQICLAKLQGPERDEFLSGLTDLLGTEGQGMDGIVARNSGALDRGRRGFAGDRRPPAMDSNIRALNTSNFLKRFPVAGNVSIR